jgi:hypothetical protein
MPKSGAIAGISSLSVVSSTIRTVAIAFASVGIKVGVGYFASK